MSGEHPISYMNVMQVLVEEKAPKYMKIFGMCTCDHCQVDVKASALNHLPAKYVVVGKGEMVPRITFYEEKFMSQIITELSKACQLVKEKPHHTR